MKYSMSAWLFGQFYHTACKAMLKQKGFPNQTIKNIAAEYKRIVLNAKDIGNSKLFSAYMMGMTLKRTQTIAEGADFCDFRYSKRNCINENSVDI